MAKDMPCHFCETSEEPEIGVMLVSDLTESGQLPFAVGLNCMESFLLGLLETFAQPEGIPAPEPSELSGEEPEFPFEVDEVIVVAHERSAEEGLEMTAEAPVAIDKLSEDEVAVIEALDGEEVPTPARRPSGRSARGSSTPAAENGSGASENLTDPVDIPTA